MDLKVDGRQLLKRALREMAPGEDIDEALLRACKALYPEQAMAVFGALGRMLDTIGRTESDASRFATATRLAASKGKLSISLHTSVTSTSHVAHIPGARTAAGSGSVTVRTVTGGSLDELPPEAAEHIRAILGGDPAASLRTTAGPAGPQQPFHCRHCGHVEPSRFDRCPHCGKRQRAGFFRRLFGR